jgi:hypothetical protein
MRRAENEVAATPGLRMIPIHCNFDWARRRLGHEIHANTMTYVGEFPAP